MKRPTINYLLVGGVVLLALGLLFVSLQRITGSSGATDRYSAVYERVAGIRYGTPVYYEGYRVGQVDEVVPEREGVQTRFRVWLAVDRGWPIPDDSVAEVATDGLLSDVFIYIRQGEATSAHVPGAELASRAGEDLFAALGDLAVQARGLADDELRPLLRRVGDRVDDIAGQLQSGTPEIVERVRELLASAQRSAGSAEELLGEANRGAVRRTLENFETSSASAAALAEELRETRHQLNEVLAQAADLIGENRPDLRRAVRGLEQTVAQLSGRLDSIAFNLDEASRHFNEFSRIIRRNPNRLLYTPESDPVTTEEP